MQPLKAGFAPANPSQAFSA